VRYSDKVGESYCLTSEKAAEHRWYYYPQMLKEEALLLKTYATQEEEIRFVFHTAFEHPATPVDAPHRTSIETRCMAIFD
jgi:hypothetical protein